MTDDAVAVLYSLVEKTCRNDIFEIRDPTALRSRRGARGHTRGIFGSGRCARVLGTTIH